MSVRRPWDLSVSDRSIPADDLCPNPDLPAHGWHGLPCEFRQRFGSDGVCPGSWALERGER